MLLPDYLSRHPVPGNGFSFEDFDRAGLSREEWVEAAIRDDKLNEMTGEWEKFQKRQKQIDGLIYIEFGNSVRLAIPEELRLKLFDFYHKKYMVHLGSTSMIRVITNIFYCPGIYSRIQEYVRSCEVCKRFLKNKRLVSIRNTRSMTTTASGPREYTITDIVGPTAKSKIDNDSKINDGESEEFEEAQNRILENNKLEVFDEVENKILEDNKVGNPILKPERPVYKEEIFLPDPHSCENNDEDDRLIDTENYADGGYKVKEKRRKL